MTEKALCAHADVSQRQHWISVVQDVEQQEPAGSFPPTPRHRVHGCRAKYDENEEMGSLRAVSGGGECGTRVGPGGVPKPRIQAQ
jgi:hypothetical protein